MLISWKVFFTILILYTLVIHGNRIRRRRQALLLDSNIVSKSVNQQQLPPNPRILNTPDQGPPQPADGNPNEFVRGKNAGRQYYYPYQGQYGYGSVQGLNYPYAGAGVGSYSYGTGPYGQYGSGQYGYGNYYQNPSYYSGYSSGSYYNRPGYYSNNYPSGNNYYGGYFWNNGQKQYINQFNIFISLLFTLIIYLTTN